MVEMNAGWRNILIREGHKTQKCYILREREGEREERDWREREWRKEKGGREKR